MDIGLGEDNVDLILEKQQSKFAALANAFISLKKNYSKLYEDHEELKKKVNIHETTLQSYCNLVCRQETFIRKQTSIRAQQDHRLRQLTTENISLHDRVSSLELSVKQLLEERKKG